MTTNVGTTVFSIVTKDAITIGADSMASHHDGHVEAFSKLKVIRNTVIACEGLGVIYKPETTGEVLYRADQWMTEIESSLAAQKINAGIVAHAIQESHPFINLVRIKEILRLFYNRQIDSGKGYLADFFVASASSDGMQLLRVRAKITISMIIDGEWRIVFDKTTYFDGHSSVDPFVRYGTGKMAEIDKAFSRNGDAYQDMLIRTNGSFGRLLNGNEVGLDELRDVVRCAISLEAKANPKQVGPPFVVATLQAGKPVSVTSYSE
jgi:hypothetical protein